MTVITWRISKSCCICAMAAAAVSSVLVGATGTATASAAPGPGAAGSLSLLASKWGGKQADDVALADGKVNRADQDPGSLYTLTRATGARQLWKHTDAAGRPLTGTGVTVALLDSGVASVPGLDAVGKVVLGPDLSGSDTTSAGDAFGHGTFMAGLIAARDPAKNKDGRSVAAEAAAPDVQEGLAPDAGLLSVKLAGADGVVSVDAVIAGLAWTVAHRNDNGMHVRVVNLSFGADALQPYEVDPLAAAVEAAWRAGIVVVASVGNDGASAGHVADPALDPFVLAVGASDPLGKVGGWDKPVLADFSQRVATGRHADLVAPGTSVVSLRAPGSTIDVGNPQGLVAGDAAGRLFRGSGTSQAAAVVSGSVALLLQAHPELTPDQVKATLVRTAEAIPSAGTDAGTGQIDLEQALRAADDIASKDALRLRTAVQSFPSSTGLDGYAPDALVGDWDGARWNGARWNGARWNGARWNGARWNGARWNGARWNGGDWS